MDCDWLHSAVFQNQNKWLATVREFRDLQKDLDFSGLERIQTSTDGERFPAFYRDFRRLKRVACRPLEAVGNLWMF